MKKNNQKIILISVIGVIVLTTLYLTRKKWLPKAKTDNTKDIKGLPLQSDSIGTKMTKFLTDMTKNPPKSMEEANKRAKSFNVTEEEGKKWIEQNKDSDIVKNYIKTMMASV